MVNFHEADIELIKIEIGTSNADLFMEYIQTPFKTVAFSNVTREDVDGYLKSLKFDQSVKKDFYFKTIDDLILVIYLEDFYIKDKFFIQKSESNLDYIRNVDSYFNSFEDFQSDANRSYTLYPESVAKMFYEHFVVMLTGGHRLLRFEGACKYENNRFLFSTVFPKDEKRVDIAYDDYSLTPDCILPYTIFFRNNKIKNLVFLNRSNNKKFSLADHADIFPLEHITLGNYHLFWENFTSEQKILFEMIAI